MSFASSSTLTEWVDDQGFQYELWTDDNRDLALYYGAVSSADASMPNRVTKVLNENGTLILEYVDNVGVNSHPAEVLADLRTIMGTE